MVMIVDLLKSIAMVTARLRESSEAVAADKEYIEEE
jgi:hypothetical protein